MNASCHTWKSLEIIYWIEESTQITFAYLKKISDTIFIKETVSQNG